MGIIVPTTKRIAEIEALAKQAVSQQEMVEAKADFIAMMCDVDLSMIEGEEEEMIDGAQQTV